MATGVLAIAALANFWYLYPVLTAETIPYQEWYSRMLLKKWI
ncbi:hypothetical protein [Thermocatellispora tengchongensis]